MHENDELIIWLQNQADAADKEKRECIELMSVLARTIATALQDADTKDAALQSQLETADARIAELTEIVESVRHIQALKTFVNSKVRKLKALNRRLR